MQKALKEFSHLLYVPFTGLGNYGGFRGNRWLKNRINIFKRFVVSSLQNQSNKNFVLWCSWRPEEKNNNLVQELISYLSQVSEFKTVHTFHGICFYDDKYEDQEARERLFESVHRSIPELLTVIGGCENVLITIQPSDDLYTRGAVDMIQQSFLNDMTLQAVGFDRGYIMDYVSGLIANYNPKTNPPFYTIKFEREDFLDPLKHLSFTSLKSQIGKYNVGTPLPSHEYVASCLRYKMIKKRGFLVGIHGDNISTVFNHPYRGQMLEAETVSLVKSSFGISKTDLLPVQSYSLRKRLLKMLSFRVQRRIRYIFGEKLWQKLYSFLRD